MSTSQRNRQSRLLLAMASCALLCVLTALGLVFPSVALWGLVLATAVLLPATAGLWLGEIGPSVAVHVLQAAPDLSLRHESEDLRRLLLHGPAVVLCVCDEGVVQHASHSASELLGVRADGSVTLDQIMVRPGYARSLLQGWFASAEVWTGGVQFVSGDGLPTLLDVTAVHDLSAGRVWLMGREEQDSSGLAQELVEAKRQAALGLLAAGVAHDFNNVLTPMVGYIEILLQDTHDPDAQEDLLHVQAAARRASSLVRQLLMLGRMKDTDPASAPRCDLGRQLTETIEQIRPEFLAHQRISLDLGATSAGVDAVPYQIDQIVLNLVTNARQAMGNSAGHVSVRMHVTSPQTARARTLHSGRWVCVRVVDDGPGMPESVVQQVFQPFFTTKEMGVGSGLGLSVVRGIVEELGGYIELRSTVREGTSFEVWLPRRPPPDDIEDEATVPAMTMGEERVLVVEDEPAVARLVSRVLQRSGYAVTTCGSAEEAMTILDVAIGAFELVLTDQTLPGQSGSALALRTSHAEPTLPVVLMSGEPHDVLPPGVWGFLPKPLTVGLLTRAVRENVDRGRGRRAA